MMTSNRIILDMVRASGGSEMGGRPFTYVSEHFTEFPLAICSLSTRYIL